MWVDFQRRYAWVPERVSPRLDAGESPAAMLRKFVPGTRPEPERLRLHTEVDRLESQHARILPRGTSHYPPRLGPLIDAPAVLFAQGNVPALFGHTVAIVGARAATRPARENARRIARELAGAGVVVVSGLARGIDAAAHHGALEAGGQTVAVMASGLDEIYPPEHRRLAGEIQSRQGVLVTEMPMGSPPRRLHFPLRNRLISGLSAAVIVVEARRRSGSLITVRHALAQGREVFVVPGAIEGPFAEGTNRLLRDGARPILSGQDVLDDLGWQRSDPEVSEPPAQAKPEASASGSAGGLQAALLERLAEGPASRDELVEGLQSKEGLQASTAELLRALFELELAERVLSDRDGRVRLRFQR